MLSTQMMLRNRSESGSIGEKNGMSDVKTAGGTQGQNPENQDHKRLLAHSQSLLDL